MFLIKLYYCIDSTLHKNISILRVMQRGNDEKTQLCSEY